MEQEQYSNILLRLYNVKIYGLQFPYPLYTMELPTGTNG